MFQNSRNGKLEVSHVSVKHKFQLCELYLSCRLRLEVLNPISVCFIILLPTKYCQNLANVILAE